MTELNIKQNVMRKKSLSFFLLGLALVVGFSIPNSKAQGLETSAVVCYYAEAPLGSGYYRCTSETSCKWIDNKQTLMEQNTGLCYPGLSEELN